MLPFISGNGRDLVLDVAASELPDQFSRGPWERSVPHELAVRRRRSWAVACAVRRQNSIPTRGVEFLKRLQSVEEVLSPNRLCWRNGSVNAFVLRKSPQGLQRIAS